MNKSGTSLVVHVLWIISEIFKKQHIKQFSIYKIHYCTFINMTYNGETMLEHSLIDT